MRGSHGRSEGVEESATAFHRPAVAGRSYAGWKRRAGCVNYRLLQARTMFAQAGQQDSEWRSWTIAARASQRTGDLASVKEYASRADAPCIGLQQKWGAEAYSDYLRRPDIQACRSQIDQLLGRSKFGVR
jgi:hypothetical protein